jgi:hypothetical protein
MSITRWQHDESGVPRPTGRAAAAGHPTTVVGATKFAMRELAHRWQGLQAEIDRLNTACDRCSARPHPRCSPSQA